MSEVVRVYLEAGKRFTFAAAVDWPGWCRRGRGEEDALETLGQYGDRYCGVVSGAPRSTTFAVIGRLVGDATTDFGAPHVVGPWDHEALVDPELGRQVAVLDECWTAFDALVDDAPLELRKGPRGGGRDREAIVAHVGEVERAYAGKLGARIPPRTPTGERRRLLREALTHAEGSAWPGRYVIRRLAWHVLDHLFEIEDRI